MKKFGHYLIKYNFLTAENVVFKTQVKKQNGQVFTAFSIKTSAIWRQIWLNKVLYFHFRNRELLNWYKLSVFMWTLFGELQEINALKI